MGLSKKSVGVNPYKFGLIGSTDSHSGLSSPESNCGKFATDSTPETKEAWKPTISKRMGYVSVRIGGCMG